jgi:hypothetical protein
MQEDPYFREDPGFGIQRLPVLTLEITPEFVSASEKWRTNDGRILPDKKSTFEFIENPFDGENGNLIKLTTFYDPVTAGRSFGGYGIRTVLPKVIEIDSKKTHIEFDLYYPFSAAGKYMRLNVWSTDTGGEGSQNESGVNGQKKAISYIRTQNLTNIGNPNPNWVADYNGEIWSKKTISVMPEVNGTWKYLNLDINTETGVLLEGDILFIGNIVISIDDPNSVKIPEIVDTEHYSEVKPLKDKYNQLNGLFMVGTIGTGMIRGIREHHYEIFVSDTNLLPDAVHPRAPMWLKDETTTAFSGSPAASIINGQFPEYTFPTNEYLQIMYSGNYKCCGHVLACYTGAPVWMRQIIPQHLGMVWDEQGKYYAYGNNAEGPFIAVHKNAARRIFFNHIMYALRHFMSKDKKYGSSAEREIVPFYSFDVLNQEIHESRHSTIITHNPNEWKSGLKNTSWLAAMTDNDFGDITQHYVYLLFKFAHIAVPNEQMAEKFKKNYNELPGYMKVDGHDKDGSIDDYILEKPPLLAYNDYGAASYTKTKLAYNMIKALNKTWLDDPLYDGRNLIEVMGIQVHDALSGTFAGENQRALALYANLIDKGLLTKIAYSELDIRIPDTAPGGGIIATNDLNIKQADTLGYQYALLYKVFTKYAKYISHVINWGTSGCGWRNSFVLFNKKEQANQAYYGVMDPDRFIKGHSYLDSFFAGEYEKINS